MVGAGLAGCEAAWQLARRGMLARRGIPVRLVDMKPKKHSPAHTLDSFSELVCSNSLKAEHLTNASGLLKAEMALLDSLILNCAQWARVPAGGALAVDREAALPGVHKLHFFDAAAPIVTLESIDMSKVFRASRYGRGADYLNCPMTEAEYNRFYDALVAAQTNDPHGFEKSLVFEGCLAVEILASRGRQTLAFGPLKPVGLVDPRTGKMPYAVVQLRQDDAAGTLYNLVGFQTRLKWGEQKRVFSLIPGLEHAEFARYGVMHRNTYLNSPDVLGANYALRANPLLRFAGQITGVEGYMESAASGLTAAIALAERLRGNAEPDFTGKTMLGALERYVRTSNAHFQPMNANFGLLEPLGERVKGKRQRYEKLAERALATLAAFALPKEEETV